MEMPSALGNGLSTPYISSGLLASLLVIPRPLPLPSVLFPQVEDFVSRFLHCVVPDWVEITTVGPVTGV